MLELRHTHGLQLCLYFLFSYLCVREHHFDNDKENCGSIILDFVGIKCLVDLQLAIPISDRCVSNPQNRHLVYEAMLVNEFLFLSIIIFPCII